MEHVNAEKHLLYKAAQGHEESFTQLFFLYKHKLYSYLLRLTDSPEMTEDVIQDVFLKLWKDRTNLVHIDQFGGYIYRMAQHHALNAFRRMAKETLILAELNKAGDQVQSDVEDQLSMREVRKKLQTAVDTLPPKQKLVYTLSREQGLKHEEIARRLNISPATVNNHMIAALRTIRQQLGTHLHTVTGASCLLLILDTFSS
ncbi:RNA polymerase sigma-70 factor (ECF subfamily) [Chitinophaga polysaccharea]|uniref:RNA polymerase sigma-70 factor (ECF subfamily) n=1 Tax=Chitinophaga polysaccharea TaxID=1293035 RepID=A0A561PCD7_9BACT|nr:RNA polymerase sigma-70 factor [Chitinophaga polysaccharea]TWF35793.1 RNA polymerase sigma-70 factor (ECF subfamily) [Chitinophaga polysaccharea]